eukprot:CAMPEP_0172455542 /NCGR_PEP_ID=MMETSP1065-20121228/12118_1 /TAXON_ID=265537 /ORGANISM="Amphiprora paludosa, Strain CCMP125" /LENGTH=427 /DNA_ID=CAMNT_0013208005 /DNA_START=163 /DNA_END=1446 /DNA_ORIENTATION=-
MISRASKFMTWKGQKHSLLQRVREVIGRALRETGQALDRSGQKLESLTWLPDKYIGGDPPVKFQDFLSRHRQKMPLLHCGKPVVHEDVAFLAPCATLIGSVRVEEGASIWYGAVLRGDMCRNGRSFDQTDQEVLELEQQDLLKLEGGKSETEDGEEEEEGMTPEEEKKQIEYRKLVRLVSLNNEVYDGGAIYVGKDTNIQDGVIVTARSSSTILGQGVTVGHLAQLHSTTVEDFALIGMGSMLQEGSHVESEALVAAGAVIPANTTVGAGELWVGNPARKVRDLTAEERQKLHYQSSEYVKVALTHPMELGENITMPWQDALLIQMKSEPDVHEMIAHNNKWNNTVYGYLTRPKEDNTTKIESGDGDEVAAKIDGQETDTRKEELKQQQSTAPEIEAAPAAEQTKSESQTIPDLAVEEVNPSKSSSR